MDGLWRVSVSKVMDALTLTDQHYSIVGTYFLAGKILQHEKVVINVYGGRTDAQCVLCGT
jgi:hypothetical protein